MSAPLGTWVEVPGTRKMHWPDDWQVRIRIQQVRDRHWPFSVLVADRGGVVIRSARTEAEARAIANEAWGEAKVRERLVLHHETPCVCSPYDMCREVRQYTGVGNRALND